MSTFTRYTNYSSWINRKLIKSSLIFTVTFLAQILSISHAQANEAYCREYQTKVEIAGKQQNAYGQACRKADGSWEIQKDTSGKAKLNVKAQRAGEYHPIVVMVSPTVIARAYMEDDVIFLDQYLDDDDLFFYSYDDDDYDEEVFYFE